MDNNNNSKIIYPMVNDAEDLADGTKSLGEYCMRQLKLIGNNVALVCKRICPIQNAKSNFKFFRSTKIEVPKLRAMYYYLEASELLNVYVTMDLSRAIELVYAVKINLNIAI